MNRLLLSVMMMGCTLSLIAQKNLLYKLKTTSLGSPVAYSNDQTFLAMAEGKDMLIYSAATHTLSHVLKGHTGQINSIGFSPDGTGMVTGGDDKNVFIWDYLQKMVIAKIEIEDKVIDAQYIDISHLAVITAEKLMVYDLPDNKLRFTKKNHTRPIRCLALAKDGKWLATGGGDGKVILYESLTGNVTKEEKMHNGWVRTLAASPDGNYLVSGDDKATVILQELNTGAQQTFSEAEGWVVSSTFSDDSKYFAVGDDRGNCMIYETQKKFLSQKISASNARVFSLDFSPDGNELAIFESTLKVWSVKDLKISSVFKVRDERDNSPPQIFISNPPNVQNDRFRYSKDFIDIRGVIVDDAGVRSLSINGMTTPLKENGNFVIHLPLAMGDNFISIEATDINANTGIKKFVINRKDLLGEEYDAGKAKNYLFAIGINEYEHWPHLSNAVRDANDVAGALMGQYNFDFNHVTILKDEQATRSNIYKSLRALIEKVSPQDNLLIYYSGHGFFDELLKEGYWVPVDAETNSTGEYLSNSDLLKIVGSIDSQHTFVIVDACFSGSLFSESKKGYAENVERYKSRWGLVSGRLETVSDGTAGKNSPFATAFLEYLNDNTKVKFGASSIVQHVKEKVAETTKQTPMGNPLKIAGDEGGEFVFYRKQ